MKENIVKVKRLHKYYCEVKGFIFKRIVRRIHALKGISFNIRRGEIFGFLGPNAASKTTTARILSTYLSFEEGEVVIGGLSLSEKRNLYQVGKLVSSQF